MEAVKGFRPLSGTYISQSELINKHDVKVMVSVPSRGLIYLNSR